MIVGSFRTITDRGTALACSVTALGAAVLALGLSAPAAARTTATFVSKLYRYSIVLPGPRSRWSATLATQRWADSSLPGIGDPQLDTFDDGKTGRTYLLAARPTMSSLAKWTKFVIAARPSVCGKPNRPTKTTVGGASAEVVRWTCSDGYRVVVGTAVRARRGYFLLVASPTDVPWTSDVRAFDAARRSFRFPP